jgi:hypothetical protein
MAYAAQSDLAMVLPLPVPSRPPDDAVSFVSLQEYPEFLADLRRAFTVPVRSRSRGMLSAAFTPHAAQLVVHEVGDVEASFVPTLSDFERLDARLRIPSAVWDELPTYQDYGFAVFKLKGNIGTRTVHPMAFEFPRRHAGVLYFPTLHIHDRTVHPGADFDHVLYCQPEASWDAPVLERWNWKKSKGPAGSHLDVSRTRGLLDPKTHLFQLRLGGHRQNKDTWVSVDATYPQPLGRA